MSFLRRLFLLGTSTTLIILLLLLAVSWTINTSFGDRNNVKSWLADSGSYEIIIAEVIKNTKEEIVNDKSGEKSEIDTEILNKAVSDVLTPEVLQEKIEVVLDGVYDWLEAETPDLQFTLDFSEEKAALTQSLADEATSRLKELPECTLEQLLELRNAEVFSIDCSPPQSALLVAEFKREFENNEDFLADTVISASDIKIETSDGVEKSLSQAVPDVQPWYEFARNTRWFSALAVLIWSIIVVFLSLNWRYGLKHLSKIFGTAAILIAIPALIMRSAANGSLEFIRPDKAGDSSDALGKIIGEAVVPIAKQVIGDITDYLLWFVLAYAILMNVFILYLLISSNRSKGNNLHINYSRYSDKLPGTKLQPEESNLEVADVQKAKITDVKAQEAKKR